MPYPELSVLIPAAGASHRLGQAKQLIKFRDKTLLQHAIGKAALLSPLEILVVTGSQANLVKASVNDKTVKWVHNPAWVDGLGSSVAAGTASLDETSEGVMIVLCDLWRLQARDLQSLADVWHADRQQIVVATADGQTMPPVIFPCSQFEELKKLKGKQGARSLIKKHLGSLTTVQMPNAAFDLDNEQQLDQLLSTP